MAGTADIFGLFPADAPDPTALQWPWSGGAPVAPDQASAASAAPGAPPAIGPEPAPGAPAALQPGIGIPQQALDAALPGVPMPAPEVAPPTPPPQPFGASGSFGPAVPPIGSLPGFSIGLDPPPSIVDDLAADPLRMKDNGPLQPTPAFSDDQATAGVAWMAENDPVGYEAYKAKRQAAKEQDLATKTLEESTRNQATAQANASSYQTALANAERKAAELEVDIKALAGESVDRDQWWSDRSTGQKILGYIAAIAGGVLAGQTGGPNSGLALISQAIDRDVDAQKTNLANRRASLGQRQTAVGEMFARTGDVYRATEAARLAAWDSTIQRLQIEQQQYDARGTTAFKIGDIIQGAAAKRAALAVANKQRDFENDLKDRAEKRQQQSVDQTDLQNRRQIGLGYAQLNDQAKQRDHERTLKADDKALERADKEAERDRQFAIGGVPHVATGPDGKPLIGEDGKPVVSRDTLRNADGRTWRAPSSEREREIADKTVATRQLVKLYDRALALRDSVGGESGAFNSGEYQELKSIEAEIKILRKQGTQGMSSDADMENLAAAGGASDLTSFRSRAAGLKAARARIVDNLNETYRTAKYTGPDLVFPPPTATANAPDEDRTQALLSKSGVSFEGALRANLDKVAAERGYGFDVSDPADQQLYRQVVTDTRATFDPEASAEQRADLVRMGRVAMGKGDEATKAREELMKIAARSDSARLRELAQQELNAVIEKPTPRGPASTPLAIPDALRLEE